LKFCSSSLIEIFPLWYENLIKIAQQKNEENYLAITKANKIWKAKKLNEIDLENLIAIKRTVEKHTVEKNKKRFFIVC